MWLWVSRFYLWELILRLCLNILGVMDCREMWGIVVGYGCSFCGGCIRNKYGCFGRFEFF